MRAVTPAERCCRELEKEFLYPDESGVLVSTLSAEVQDELQRIVERVTRAYARRPAVGRRYVKKFQSLVAVSEWIEGDAGAREVSDAEGMIVSDDIASHAEGGASTCDIRFTLRMTLASIVRFCEREFAERDEDFPSRIPWDRSMW